LLKFWLLKRAFVGIGGKCVKEIFEFVLPFWGFQLLALLDYFGIICGFLPYPYVSGGFICFEDPLFYFYLDKDILLLLYF
jgi:hypothetical protein